MGLFLRRHRAIDLCLIAISLVTGACSALLSDASPSSLRLGELLEGEAITDKLRRCAQFHLNHYELATGEAAEYG